MEFLMSIMGYSVLLIGLAAAQGRGWEGALLNVLSKYPQLSRLSTEVAKSSNLSAQFNAADNFTLLAPTDTAISTWLSSFTTNVSLSYVEAVLSYHLLHGRYATASITNSPPPIRSWLTDEQYANVTGGQRVEVSNADRIEIRSGAKSVSRITTGDILSNNGFVHIIDTVLELPSIFGVTASAANLSYIIALLDKGHYLQNSTYSMGITTRRDTTYFAPNSAVALANAPSNTSFNSLLEYHCVNKLVYSADLTNGTELTTFTGAKVLITVDDDGSIYVNTAKVIGMNYLLYNGVMHLLDNILDPRNIARTPATVSTAISTLPTTTPSADTSGIHSAGAKAGIGVGAAAAALAIILFTLFAWRRRQQQQRSSVSTVVPELSGHHLHEIPQLETRESNIEVQGSHPLTSVGEIYKLGRPAPAVELPCSEWHNSTGV